MKFIILFLILSSALSVSFSQTITTVAGTSDPGFGGDGGDATKAQLNQVAGLALDSQGNLYIHDSINTRIRKVTPSGTITTVAGNGAISEPVEGSVLQTGFISIYGIAVKPDGTLYIADASGLQVVDLFGNLSFVVTGTSIPGGIRISRQGVLYTGGVSVINQLNPDQSQTPVAGSDVGDSGDGGPATQALFFLTDFAIDSVGDIYLADSVANRVRKFTPGGNISAVAGNGTNDFSGDGGPGAQAQLNIPSGVAVDVAGNVYISDSANQRVRRVTTGGVINTFAGSGPGDGSTNGDGGPALKAILQYPTYLAVTCKALYVSDTNSVRAIALTDPLIAQRGVTNSTTGATSIRAGTNFQISGCNLARTTSDAGTTVSLNGVQVQVVSVSPTLVVAQVPFGFPSGPAVVTVALDGIDATATASTIVE